MKLVWNFLPHQNIDENNQEATTCNETGLVFFPPHQKESMQKTVKIHLNPSGSILQPSQPSKLHSYGIGVEPRALGKPESFKLRSATASNGGSVLPNKHVKEVT